MRWFYIIKFLLYGGISAYDYSIHSKYTLYWALLAGLMMLFYFEVVIKELKEN